MKIDFDVDIDMANREDILRLVRHIPASIRREDQLTKHNSGIYFQSIPIDPLVGISAIEYKAAEEAGWFKVDFLNNHIYSGVKNEQHLDQLLNTEPVWELLEHAEITEQLVHINKHSELVSQYKPVTVEQLAMILAIIRPAKRHLVGKDWDTIRQTVWDKPADGEYYFKKAHAIAYATSIVVQLNLLSGY